jgi:hypothetical protein
MIFEQQSKNKTVLLVIFALFLIGGVSYIVWSQFSSGPEAIVCTQEAEQCPDENADVVWKTFADDTQGISFRYPENPVDKYMEAIDWPPKVQILNEAFTCTEAGSETARAGQTLKRMVDNRTYCITKVTEGAAGSVYTQYAYAFPKDNKTVIFTFSIRYVQCGNYSEPEKTECENVRTAFDLDSAIDRIAQTVRMEVTSSKTSDSGIRGTVLLGPTCPVVMDPPDPQCADKPYKTNLVLTTADQSRVITEFGSDANGKFSVKIEPGRYAIRSAAAANILPYCSHDTFKVEMNKFTDITVSCDTGIR